MSDFHVDYEETYDHTEEVKLSAGGRTSQHDFAPHADIYTLPSGYLSVSQIGLWQKCGERYRRNYVENMKRPTSSNLGQGKLVHRAVEGLLAYKIANKQEMPPAEMGQDLVTLHMTEMTQDIEVWDPKVPTMEALETSSRELVKMYTEERLPTALPRAVELKITAVFRGRVPFIGYVDHVEQSPIDLEYPDPTEPVKIRLSDSVRDLKSTGRKYGPSTVEDSLQLTTYATALGVENVGFDLLVLKKKNEFVKQDAFRTPDAKEHALDVVEDVAQAITKGVFPRADPESWMCTEKWCPFYKDCRGRQRSYHHVTTSEDV